MAKRKTLFDDRPVEINELTYVIKQDLSSLNSQISSLQSLSKSQQTQTSRSGAEQEGEHNKNVCIPTHKKGTGIHIPIGRCITARQACRRRCQFQRGARSPHKESPGLSIPHRKLRLIRFSTFSATAQSPAICISSIQYSYKIPDATAGVPELESRHPESGSWLVFSADAKRCPVGPTALNDGRSTASEYVH